MNILLLGSGAREHALAYKLTQSPLCTRLFIAPGNAGTERQGDNVQVSPLDFAAIRSLVLRERIELVVCGPEEPLVKGIADFFAGDPALAHVAFAGPSRQAALLEGSKAFAKGFMKKYGIPTAPYRIYDSAHLVEALDYVKQHPLPVVIKADGLAAGKGVFVCETEQEAKEQVMALLRDKKLGVAGTTVVIEQFLQGIEMSVFILTDGQRYVLLPEAKDYKRIGEGNTGPNTGGMGALSPVPFANAALMQKIEHRILQPTLKGLQQEEITYRGFLYVGLMIVGDDPFVVEYNCRLGDPETQVVVPRIRTDLVNLLVQAATDELQIENLDILPYKAVGIVLASKGYPGSYETGRVIENLSLTSECLIFHAGTRRRTDGQIETAGGRVLTVTAFDRSLAKARQQALRNAELIRFEGKYFRRDIGDDVGIQYH
ncbi:MAG: phosphoribosylamine--glycine ligase [Chitinophagales bacterium]|nr:phosphoribosylamine--glycine ligase [Chitinophagales bacterium]MDW8426933.1 phosphoribosylamine--glycine ligase [Chitinophagales bacterium]